MALPSRTKEMGSSLARERKRLAHAWLCNMSAGFGVVGMACVVLLAAFGVVVWIAFRVSA
jgi:hypothetical protein